MRAKLIVSTVALFLTTITTLWAQPTTPPPGNGTYYSTDLGGTVFTGHVSESWAGTTSGYGEVGNTILVSSVNGPAVGTQWELWCASITARPMLVKHMRDSTGTGEVTWQSTYTGGQFWLAGDGPWATGGSIDFTGVIDSLIACTTYTYSNGEIIGVHSIYLLSGRFDPSNWYGSCVECMIDNVTFIGSTDQEPKPEAYPPFMAPNCGPWIPCTGAWGTVADITIRIYDCTQTPVKEATWGEIKVLYDD